MEIDEIVAHFKKSGRFATPGDYSKHDIAEWENLLGISFPESYREIMTAGSIDKDTFHCFRPYRSNGYPDLLVFGSWNNQLFAFDITKNTEKPDYPVLLLSPNYEPEEKYGNFLEWIEMVLDMTSRPVNPE